MHKVSHTHCKSKYPFYFVFCELKRYCKESGASKSTWECLIFLKLKYLLGKGNAADPDVLPSNE